ncbi:hypothetical protein HGRIS_012926 [Hohenbuehelia grisea]|uniref:Monopolin complex subunit Csm1/Pcs1 C-terminal domain-containing protein n=1 Tax=Hohenbuehelia grisea TaxID=104357 RepID=A0ABR3ITZ6_9AGAR
MDSDDELAGQLNESSPHQPTRKRPASSKPASKASAAAGPSKPNTRPQRAKANGRIKKPANSPPVDVSSGRSDRDSEIETIQPEPAKPKGKGKEKASNPAKSVKKASETIVIDHDDTDDLETQPARKLNRSNGQKNQNKAPPASSKSQETLALRLEQCMQRLAESESRNEALSNQLNEALSIRETEAEELLASKTRLYESLRETQEKMSLELTSQLARIEPLSRSGSSSVLHLMTREAADEEKRLLEQDIARLKENLAEKDRIISQRDKKIGDLLQTEKELNFELSQVRTAKTRATPGPSGTQQSHKLADDPKVTELIKFYEDLTDLLVTNLHVDPTSEFGKDKDEWVLSCLYTCAEAVAKAEENPGVPTSLNFTLRSCWEKNEEDPKNPKQTIHYIPLNLKAEKPEFVQQLEFLGNTFVFERAQLALFLRTLRDNMVTATGAEDGAGEDADAEDESMEAVD